MTPTPGTDHLVALAVVLAFAAALGAAGITAAEDGVVENTSDDVADTTEEVEETTAGTADETTDGGEEPVGGTTTETQETVGGDESLQERSADAAKTVEEPTDETLDGTNGTVDETLDGTNGTVDGTTDEANETADETVDGSTETVTDSVDGTNDTVEETADDVDETVDEVNGTVEETADGTTDAVSETTEGGTDAVDSTTEATSSATDPAAETTEAATPTATEPTDAASTTATETMDVASATATEPTDAASATATEASEPVGETPTVTETVVYAGGEPADDGGPERTEAEQRAPSASSDSLSVPTLDGRETSAGDEKSNASTAGVTTDDAAVASGTGGDGDRPANGQAEPPPPAAGGGSDGSSPPAPASPADGALLGLVTAVGSVTAVRTGTVLAAVGPQSATAAASDLPRTVLATLRSWLPRIGALAGYSKFDFDDPLANDNREAVFDAVEATPGINLTSLVEATDLSESTVRYHLRVLQREDLLSSAKVRGRRRYLPARNDGVELTAALAEDPTRAVLEALAEREPATGATLAEALGRDRSTVSHHLSRLEEAGLVEREPDGPALCNHLAPEVRAAIAAPERTAERRAAGHASADD